MDTKRFLLGLKDSIKVISFDMDGVLVSTAFDDYLWNQLLPSVYAKEHAVSLRAAQKKVFTAYKTALGTNAWTSLAFWFKQFNLPGDYHVLLEEAKRKKLKVYKDTSVLKDLSKKYTLILITQAPIDFIETKIFPLKKYFDRLYSVPDHFSRIKKDEHIYRKVLVDMNVKAHEMLHIGDDYPFDIICARNVGIHTLYVTRKKNGKGVSTLHGLRVLT